MSSNDSGVARRLMEAFLQFKRLHWHQSPIAGLRHSELTVLYCIKRKAASDGPGIKVSEISNILKVASPTITQLINSLETKGLIERGVDKEDRRAVPITLTDEGEIAVKKATDAGLAYYEGLAEYLGEEDSNKLAGLLSKVFIYVNETRRRNSQLSDWR